MPHEASPEFRAQTIELFFDLVFVFVITQITRLVERAQSAVDLLHAFAVLMLIWWMYGGYIWLTNHAHTPKSMRLVLAAAMVGFLVMALAVPASNGEARVAFGLAYLFVVVLHFVAFAWRGGAEAARAMFAIVPFNLAACIFVIVAGRIDTSWSWVLLLGPAVIYTYLSIRNTGEGFSLNASHFVERHGLLLIIVLGETVIAIGSGLQGQTIDARMIINLALSVMLIAGLWWTYFDVDDARAEHIMVHSDNRLRTRIAMFGYTACHLVMIAGLVMVAAGLRSAAGVTGQHRQDLLLLLGSAVYLAGHAIFRQVLGVRPVGIRMAAAALLALLAWLDPGLREAWLIALVVVILVVIPALEATAERRNEGRLNP